MGWEAFMKGVEGVGDLTNVLRNDNHKEGSGGTRPTKEWTHARGPGMTEKRFGAVLIGRPEVS